MGRRYLDVARVKAAIAPARFYKAELPAMPTAKKEQGWVSGGLCPFHKDARAGNFRVNLSTGAFHCFACGQRGWDIVAFAQRRHGLSFPDAVRMIANTWGIRI